MTIEFYNGSGSPFAWYVWFALEHKGLDYNITTLSFSNKETRKPAFLKLNPHHRVPVIVDGDFILYESQPIVEYLDEEYPDNGFGPLFLGSPKDKAIIRRLVVETYTYLHYYLRNLSIPFSFSLNMNGTGRVLITQKEKH